MKQILNLNDDLRKNIKIKFLINANFSIETLDFGVINNETFKSWSLKFNFV